MLDSETISNRQFIILVVLVTVGDSILVLPSILVLEANRDAWISGVFGILAGLLIVILFSITGKLYPNKTLVETIQLILGKWLGSIISLLFLTYPFLSVVVYLREMGDFMTTTMMPETPIQAIVIMGISVSVMGVWLGLKVICLSSEFFFPWIIILFSIFTLFLLPVSEIDQIKPVIENGLNPALRGSLHFTAFPFMELIGLLMIFPSVKDKNNIHTDFLKGALLGGIILLILTFLCLLVLGSELTERNIYPSYSLAKRVGIDHLLERVEGMLALIWILSIHFKISIYLYAFILGIAQLLKLKEYRVLILPSTVTIVSFVPVIAPNITYYNLVLRNYWPFYDATVALILPMLLIVVYYFREKIRKISHL